MLLDFEQDMYNTKPEFEYCVQYSNLDTNYLRTMSERRN